MIASLSSTVSRGEVRSSLELAHLRHLIMGAGSSEPSAGRSSLARRKVTDIEKRKIAWWQIPDFACLLH
jgi:hypothetical protein